MLFKITEISPLIHGNLIEISFCKNHTTHR